ncbi:MAG: electron transport complex subunit RsxB [Undibacterium sp.]|nr:electron transport complex subunit RsxB [Undibacterium sp.]
MSPPTSEQINALLPQTQCTKCGYPSCRQYAQAIVNQEANYNQCPPGGQEGVARLAQALNQPVIALNTIHGVERRRSVALIEEALCIGCTLCIQACPVDAIMGANKQMHTVITDLCTGCDLCVAPCPVDCITMITTASNATGWLAWSADAADAARRRYEARELRLVREQQENEAKLLAKAKEKFRALEAEMPADQIGLNEKERKKKIILEAIKRASS